MNNKTIICPFCGSEIKANIMETAFNKLPFK